MMAKANVLVIGPELILGWTESTARALESLGCRVATHFYNRSRARRGIHGIRRALAQRLGIRLASAPLWLQERYLVWMNARKSKALIRAARAFRPDLVLVLKGESLTAETLQELKAVTRAPLAVWWVDHPLVHMETNRPWQEVPKCLPLFDACFVFDRSYEPVLRRAGVQTVRFLPCAADPHWFRPLVLTPADRERYGVEVSLVGVYSESRGRVVAALLGEPRLGLWGPGWVQFCTRQLPGCSHLIRGEALLPEDACKVYNATAVNLNTHHPQTRLGGMNTRTFEILAARAFELTDYVSGIEELLEPGRDVAVYRCPDEAAELARYYWRRPDERQRMAESGHRRVLAEHTYRHRMETVLAVLRL